MKGDWLLFAMAMVVFITPLAMAIIEEILSLAKYMLRK